MCVPDKQSDHMEENQVYFDNDIESYKLILIWICFVSIEMVFMKYLAWRVNRFLRGHCPNGKMSCIGKYPRNLINFKQTTYWLLCWQVNLLLDIPFQSFLEADQTLSKQSKFYIWTAKGVFLNECFIFVALTIKVPDSKTRFVQPGQFYVRSPILEPRRPILEPRKQPQLKREPKASTSAHLETVAVVEWRAGEGSWGMQNRLVGNQNESGDQDKPGCSQSSSMRRGGGGIVYSWSLIKPDISPLPCVYDTYE